MVAFVICVLAAFIVGTWYDGNYKEKHMIAEVDYSSGIQRISSEGDYVRSKIESKSLSINNEKLINEIIVSAENYNSKNTTVKLYITDKDGRVLYKSKNSKENSLNMHDLIRRSAEFRREYNNSIKIDTDNGIVKKRIVLDKVKEYVEIDSISFSEDKAYLVITGIPEIKTTYIRPNGSPISVIQGIVVFIALFYFLTSKKMRYIEKVSEGLFQIAKNNLDYRIEIQGKDELAKLSDNINFMAKELKERIERERSAEKTKNELVTNVSHDLRTPLTSIKGYLALVKDGRYKNETELEDFVNIAYNKSEKLEVLIKDLFEYTKLNNNGMSLNIQSISLNELLEQLIEELYIICEENNIIIKKKMPEKKIYAEVDGDKIVRVFENLLMNAIRYSPKPGEIKLKLWSEEKAIVASIENECKDIKKEDLDKIFHRFYRVDKSRSEGTGGSGLGLAISKSIVELHGGKIWSEIHGENIIFFVKL
ncbi:GHKL domain-containing protein [Clostridium sp. DJ247]|nr:GHKL domain-containing protein [Clostridium sp. DJ247]